MRALEAELGSALFARDGKRVRLTETGRRFAKEVRAALMALSDATREVRSGGRERRLVVSSASSFSARWITPRIGSFIERNPHIDLELVSTNVLTDFSREDVDVAIRFGLGNYPDLHVEPLLDEVFFPVCAPTLNGGMLPRTPADLANVQLLRSDEPWRPWFETAGVQKFGEPRRGVLYLDSSNLLQAAIEGQGVALVRRSIAMHEIAAGHLVRLFNIDATSPASYFFVCPPPLVASPRVQAFRNWIFEEVERFRALYAWTCSGMCRGGPDAALLSCSSGR